MFNQEEIKVWEEEVDLKRFNSWKMEKVYHDPCRARLYKRRYNHAYGSSCFAGKESTWRQRKTRRDYRHQMNQLLQLGKEEEIRPFQKTSGWLTW